MWAKTPRARIAHLYAVCEDCGGKGWLMGEGYGPFGLQLDPDPCMSCGGPEGDYDGWPHGGRGYHVVCGYISWSDARVVEAPDALRCNRCTERMP